MSDPLSMGSRKADVARKLTEKQIAELLLIAAQGQDLSDDDEEDSNV